MKLEKASFTDTPWQSPKSQLEANDYCAVCLVDENTVGEDKIKEKCHLPVRSKPGAPYSRGAIRNAAARLSSTQMSAESKASARRKLIRLAQAAGIDSELGKILGDTVELHAELFKAASAPLQVAYSVAYPVFPPGEADADADMMTASEVEKMAHLWMADSQRYDLQHQVLDIPKSEAVIVESYLAPIDFDWPLADGTTKHITKGSWIVATKFGPQLWPAVESGEIAAYSIRGKGFRRPKRFAA